MNHRIKNRGRWLWVMIGLWLGLVPLTSMARIDVKVNQSGNNVELKVTGSAKTNGLTLKAIGLTPRLDGPSSNFIVGNGISGLQGYGSGFVPPATPFGTGFSSSPTSATGSLVGANYFSVFLPTGYKTGAALSGTTTYNNSTLCSLGLTAGTYTWKWGTGSNADSLVMTIAGAPPSPAPTVTAVSPASGSSAGWYTVTLAGTDFCGVAGIKIGGVACQSFNVYSPTSASCTVPPGVIGPASVVVTTAGGSNAANTLFTYKQPPPTVTTVSPSNGPAAGGTTITITGTGFTNVTGITVGGQACASYTVVSDTSATCITPAGNAGRADVIVTTAGGSNYSNTLYTYLGDCNGFNQTNYGDYACLVPAGTTRALTTPLSGHMGAMEAH